MTCSSAGGTSGRTRVGASVSRTVRVPAGDGEPAFGFAPVSSANGGAEGIDIRPTIDRETAQHLRRGEGGSASAPTRFSDRRGILDGAGQPGIGDKYAFTVGTVGDQDVRRFDIAVQQILLMRVMQPLRGLAHDARRPVRLQSAGFFVHEFARIGAVDILHRHPQGFALLD